MRYISIFHDHPPLVQWLTIREREQVKTWAFRLVPQKLVTSLLSFAIWQMCLCCNQEWKVHSVRLGDHWRRIRKNCESALFKFYVEEKASHDMVCGWQEGCQPSFNKAKQYIACEPPN